MLGDLVVMIRPDRPGQTGIVVRLREGPYTDVLWEDGKVWRYVNRINLRVVQGSGRKNNNDR